VIFGETSSTGGLRAFPAISAYARVSTRTSRYITFARLALAGKTSVSEEAERLRRFGLNPDGSIAAVSVHSDALDVLSEVLMWQLAAPRWQAIEEVLIAMAAALQTNDLEALAEATIDLELAGPVRITRIGGTSLSAPTDAVRSRVVQLIRSLNDRRRVEEEHYNAEAGR